MSYNQQLIHSRIRGRSTRNSLDHILDLFLAIAFSIHRHHSRRLHAKHPDRLCAMPVARIRDFLQQKKASFESGGEQIELYASRLC